MTTRRYKNSWTPEEDALLRKCVAAGMQNTEIAPKFPNRTLAAVGSRRAFLKCKGPLVIFPQDDPATVAQIVKFRMAGWRLKDIENATGVNTARLSWLQARAGIKLPPVIRMPATNKDRWTSEEVARLRKAILECLPISECFAMFPNRTPAAVGKKHYLLRKNEVIVERAERWQETVVVERSMRPSQLRDLGLTIDEIAEVKGMSRVDVFKQIALSEQEI